MKPNRSRLSLVALFLVGLAAATSSAQPQVARPTAHDIAGLSTASAPQLSPDSRMVVYSLRTRSFDADAVESSPESEAGWSSDQQLWIVPAAGAVAPRQITFGDSASYSPRFSPDGRWIAYLRQNDGAAQIHLLRISSGAYGGAEPRTLDTGDLTPRSIAFSPDSKAIAFLATPAKTDAEKEAKQSSGGAVKFGEEWRNAQLYVMPIGTGETGGNAVAITDGAEHVTDYAWSPAANRFAIVTSQSADPYYAFSLKTPKVIDARTGDLVRTLETKPGAIGHIEWSPDTRFVAYEKGAGTLSLLNEIVVQDVRRGVSFNATKSLDPTLTGFVWTADGSIVAHVYERTTSEFYRLSADGKDAEQLPSPGRVFGAGFVTDANRRFAVGMSSTPTEPANPTTVDLKTGAVVVVADAHEDVKDWTMARAEVVRWRSPEGVDIDGVLWLTPHAPAGRPAPLMVLPHGGPDAVTSQGFGTWAQYFAARGFNVFRPNYRGSFGFGFDFYAANRGRMGEIEFMDIESGVDHLIETGKADPSRLVYGGWSWGGFCTAYTVAHSDRYRAAVAGAPITDAMNQYALSDINHGVAAKWEYTGEPWTKPGPFDRASAVRHIADASIPTLIIQGMKDNRVPFGQGITLYRALSDVGCEVKFLAYPREPHGFREPAHTEHMLTAWANWCQEHLESEE